MGYVVWALGGHSVGVLWFRTGCVSARLHPVWDAPPLLRFTPSQTASTIPLQVERRSRMTRRAMRLSGTTDKGIQEATRKGGWSPLTIRTPFSRTGTVPARRTRRAEERLAASVEQVRREIFRRGGAQRPVQGSYYGCVFQSGRAADGSRRRAGRPERTRLLESTGQAMAADSPSAAHDENRYHGANEQLGRQPQNPDASRPRTTWRIRLYNTQSPLG